jgi:hypothetical protein
MKYKVKVYMFHEFGISISVVVTYYTVCYALGSVFRVVYAFSCQRNVGIALQFSVFNTVCIAVKFLF